jgi:hypothetical protein
MAKGALAQNVVMRCAQENPVSPRTAIEHLPQHGPVARPWSQPRPSWRDRQSCLSDLRRITKQLIPNRLIAMSTHTAALVAVS